MRWAWIGAILCTLILVPFFLWGEQLESWSTAASSTSAFAIAGLLALDVILPIPSSVISTAAGTLLGVAGGTLANFAGMTGACLSGYWIGSRGATLASRFVGESSLARAQRLMDRYGVWALLLMRPIPVLAEASVVLAGMIRAPQARFLYATAGANLAISFAYAWLGASLKR